MNAVGFGAHLGNRIVERQAPLVVRRDHLGQHFARRRRIYTPVQPRGIGHLEEEDPNAVRLQDSDSSCSACLRNTLRSSGLFQSSQIVPTNLAERSGAGGAARMDWIRSLL